MIGNLSVTAYSTTEKCLLPTERFSDLPNELLGQIFKFIEEKNNVNACLCLNKKLKKRLNLVITDNVIFSVNKFIKVLIQKIPEIFDVQKKLLEKIQENNSFQHVLSSKNLQEKMLKVQKELIDVLKTLDTKTPNALQNFVRPIYLHPDFTLDVFTLSLFEKRIDEAKVLSDRREKNNALSIISHDLAKDGYIDRAVNVAKKITKRRVKEKAFENISKALLGDELMNEVLRLSWVNSYESQLAGISVALANLGHFDKALKVAEFVCLKKERDRVF